MGGKDDGSNWLEDWDVAGGVLWDSFRETDKLLKASLELG